MKIKAYTNDLQSGELEEENVKEAIELGVLTREQALEMGFAVVMEAETNENAAQDILQEQMFVQNENSSDTDSIQSKNIEQGDILEKKDNESLLEDEDKKS